ncbi:MULTISPECIES: hypothetical protein [Providencia]|uniref:Uncharacterized protein n=6 Tax=Providencia rustigianii TaxID=158850 RepID=D1NXE3_9GAMM|nr:MULTISPECIES: hypothetical protein [Providencia]EFB74082.1 hypothetical protein PROVRUST_04572 [Providencia rustigianii DSM 4541]SUC26224.1 Uncharacterised protein [Providencia rustigianii]SUC34929.1 Uncharacterised protein [Providencia rustigianii]
MKAINTSPQVQIRRMSVTDQQGKTTEFTRTAKSVKNDSQQHPQVTTDKKTVHLKDIKQLHNEVNTLISSIKDILFIGENIPTKHLITNDLPIFKNINNKINELGKKITELKDKLDSSSYKHHKSKKIDLESLEKEYKSENSQINRLKNEMTKLQETSPSSKELLEEEQQDKKIEPQRGYYDLSDKIAERSQRKRDYAENGYK